MSLDGEVRIAIQVDANEAVRALGNVERATKKATEATRQKAQALALGGVEIGKFGSAIGLAGSSLGQFSGAIGGVIGKVGHATSVIQSLSTVGLGPLGIALGVVSTAANVVAQAFNEAERNIASAARAIRNDAIPTFQQALDLIHAAERERTRQQAMAMGAGSPQEYLAALNAAAAEQARIHAQFMLARQGQIRIADEDYRRMSERARQLRVEIERLRNQLREAERIEAELAQADAEEAMAQAAASPRQRRHAGGGRAREAQRGDPEIQTLKAKYETMRALEEEERERREREEQRDLDETLRLLAYENEERQRALAERERMEEEARRRQLEKERDYQEHLLRIREESARRQEAIAESIGSALESATSAAIASLLDGSKSADEAFQALLAGFARQVVGEATIGALKETALGIAAAAIGNPAAAGHFTAAGMWAAAGAAAAAIGGAAGAFSAPRQPSGTAASGPPMGPSRVEGRGDTTIVVNLGGPVVTAATEAELGRRISDLVSIGASRLPP